MSESQTNPPLQHDDDVAVAVETDVEPAGEEPVRLNLEIDAPQQSSFTPRRSSNRRYTLGLDVEVPDAEEDAYETRPQSQGKKRFGEAPEAEYLIDPRDKLSAKDRIVLERIERVAFVMDELVPIPGTRVRIGLDPLLGIMPWVGDIISTVVSIYVLIEAIRFGANVRQLLRMSGHVALDAIFGLIPFVGDVFDAFYKANVRNLEIIRDEVLGFAQLEGARDKGGRGRRGRDERGQRDPDASADEAPAEDLPEAEVEVDAEHTLGVQIDRTEPAPIRKSSSAKTRILGATLIGGIVTAFTLPWAILLYVVLT